MRTELKEKYIALVEFLGLVLGPSYEIALHDISLKNKSIIAIANGHITGRSIGGSVPASLRQTCNVNYQPHENYKVNYTTLTSDKKQLRSSTLYIKDAGRIVGLLCITFDDTNFRKISKQILGLCHPDQLLIENTFEKVETLKVEENSDIYQTEVGRILPAMLESIMSKHQLPIEKMKRGDKLKVIAELDKKGGFLVKGAVEELASMMGISVPTIYRYLREIKKAS